MITKDLIREMGTKSFTIMKCLLNSHVRKSHLPPQTHSSRAPGSFTARCVIVRTYPYYCGVKYTQ